MIARARRWTCAHCKTLNGPGENPKKCARCLIRRATKRTSLSARCDKLGRRFVTLAPRLPNLALLYAVAEAGIEGHHAAGALIEPYLRSRCARIGETLREIEKDDNERRGTIPRRGMRSIADILGGAA